MDQQAKPLDDKQEEFMQKVRERKQSYVDTFESAAGLKVLEDLSRLAFANRTTFDANPQQMAFNEGQRSVVLHIINSMKIDLEKTEKLLKTQNEGEDNV